MKREKTFTTRRLRPSDRRDWRYKIEIAAAATLSSLAILLAMAGMASLMGHPSSLPWLSHMTPVSLLVIGMALLWLGILAWRISSIRQHLQQRKASKQLPDG